MRTIALVVWLGVACFAAERAVQLNKVQAENKGDCGVSYSATAQLPSDVVKAETSAPGRAILVDKELKPYVGPVTYTTDSVSKSITFNFTVNRHQTRKIDGLLELRAVAPALADLRFMAGKLAVTPGKNCQVFVPKAPAVELSNDVRFAMREAGRDFWQVAGVVSAKPGFGGPVTIRGAGWSEAVTIGDQPVSISKVFYSPESPEQSRIEIVETDTQNQLASMMPELSAAKSPFSMAEWIALGIGALTALSAGLLWYRNQRLEDTIEVLAKKLSEVQSVQGKPQPVVVPLTPPRSQITEKELESLRREFDARYATVGQLNPALTVAAELKQLKAAIGDPDVLRSYDAKPASAESASSPRDSFCAVVNEWLNLNPHPARSAILKPLQQFGFPDCWLASLEGIAEAQQDPTNPLFLTPKADGWWLVAAFGNQEYLACPLDSSYLSQGNFSLVKRWFDGLASETTGFGCLQSPVVLRQVRKDAYTAKTKGMFGEASLIGEGRVPTLQSIEGSAHRGSASCAAGQSLVSRLGGLYQAMRSLEQAVPSRPVTQPLEAPPSSAIEEKLRASLEEKLQTANTSLAQSMDARFGDLTQEIQNLKQRMPEPVPVVAPRRGEAAIRLAMAAAATAATAASSSGTRTVPPQSQPDTGTGGVAWQAVFAAAKARGDMDSEPGSAQDYLSRLKQVAHLASGQIVRAVRRDNLIGVISFPDPDQIPADRNVFLMVVGRQLKNGCWEVVPPKGEIPVDSTAGVMSFLLPNLPLFHSSCRIVPADTSHQPVLRHALHRGR